MRASYGACLPGETSGTGRAQSNIATESLAYKFRAGIEEKNPMGNNWFKLNTGDSFLTVRIAPGAQEL